MFPSANSPTPPVATNPTSLPSLHSQLHALTNELSPPNSQERVRTQDTLIANDSMDVEPQVGHNSEEDNATKGKRVEIATGSEQTMRGGAEHPAEVEDVRQPGWEWKNEKAREEAARSLEQVVDRDFSLGEYCSGRIRQGSTTGLCLRHSHTGSCFIYGYADVESLGGRGIWRSVR